MRQKLTFTAIVIALVIMAFIVAYREQESKQKLSFPDSLELTAVTVDGKVLTLRDMAFYIAYEEGQIERDAKVYNPDNTGEYWNLFTNHTFIRSAGKQTAMDMAVHDEIFYQLAMTEGLELTEEEETYLVNDQYDFWSDLEEEQRKRLGVSEDDVKNTMRKLALAEKYQYLLAAMNNKDFDEYSITGAAYQKLLEEHDYELDTATWDRVPFGSITVNH